MFFKPLLLVLGTIVVAATAGRLDNTYLPPTNAASAGGNGNILGAPEGGANQPTGVESDSDSASGSNPDAGAAILKFDNEQNGDGSYKFEYETENEIHHSESGELKNAGEENEAMSVQGSYSYMGPDGVMYTVTYIADENGFRATGEHIPTAPPVPEAIQKALDKIAEMDTKSEQNGESGGGQQYADKAASAGENGNGPYQREHNQDTQAVVIEAEPQYQAPQTTSREYLPPNQANVPSNGYRY